MTTGKNLNDKENLLLILTGRGGSADGFGNKYGKIRDRVREKYGFSVYIVRTPQDVWERKNAFFEEAVSAVIQYQQIYMMGVSAGASIALWYAAGYPQIVRVLAVNPVLQINFDMALSGRTSQCRRRRQRPFGKVGESAGGQKRRANRHFAGNRSPFQRKVGRVYRAARKIFVLTPDVYRNRDAWYAIIWESRPAGREKFRQNDAGRGFPRGAAASMRDLFEFIRKNTLTAAAFGKHKEIYAAKIIRAQEADGKIFAATSEGREEFGRYLAGSVLIGYGGSAAAVPEFCGNDGVSSFEGSVDLFVYAKELASDGGGETDFFSQLRRFGLSPPKTAPQRAAAVFDLLFAYAKEQKFRSYLQCVGGLKNISVGDIFAKNENKSGSP